MVTITDIAVIGDYATLYIALIQYNRWTPVSDLQLHNMTLYCV